MEESRKGILGINISRCKSPEVRMSLECLRVRQKILAYVKMVHKMETLDQI